MLSYLGDGVGVLLGEEHDAARGHDDHIAQHE